MDNKIIFAGVIIEGLNLPYPELYYVIPSNLISKIEIGKKVLIPFGENNTLKLGYLIKLTENLREEVKSQEIKEIKEVFDEALFDEKIAELLQFTSNNFFVHLHELANFIYGSASRSKIKITVKCIDLEKAKKLFEETKSLQKKELLKKLLDNKSITYGSLKFNLNRIPYDYIKDLEDNHVIVKTTEIIRNERITYRISKERIENALKEYVTDKGIILIIKRAFSRKNNTITVPDDVSRIKNWRIKINELEKKGYINRIPEVHEPFMDKEFYLNIIEGGSFEERNRNICKILKEKLRGPEKALIIFPEVGQIKKAYEIYQDEFNNQVVYWEGKKKSEIVNKVDIFSRIILTTNFGLFLKLPSVSHIVIEDASSKYHRVTDYNLFDSRIVAFKKCKMEKKELTLSYVSTDDVIENLKTLENVKNQIKFSVITNVKIIDMRQEFKGGNYSMLSRYTFKRIKEELEKNNNIALLLNRKPYATFVMCRECGYVLKCPVCNSTLYFDIKKGSLYCPVCGYSQKPVEKCPRCGSIAIHYFGGGLQKLEKLLKKELAPENLILLTGETKIEIPSSRSFKRTIFAGTEYITEHLDFSNISLFVFVSIDTFINSYDFEASFNALRVSSSVIYEMKNNEVIFQTYMPENAQIQAIKSTDHSKFIIDELELRKELGYPPSRNLIVLKILDNYEKAKDIASFLAKSFENCYILGPTISTSTLSKISYEISIKTEEKLENLFGQVQAIMNKAGVVYKLYVYPAPAIILC